MKRILFFMTLVLAFNLTANTQNYEWVGGDGGPDGWGDPNNWENEFGQPELPGYGADIYIGGFGSFIYYDPQFVDLFNSITIYDNASLLATTDITVISNFYLEESSSVVLQLNDVDSSLDGIIQVLDGTYDIDGDIIPEFGGNSFVPQINDEIVVATAGGSGSTCGIFNSGNAIYSDNGISMYEVAYNVMCISPNEIIVRVNGLNYTGAKSWDGEAGNSLWSSPANWDPNGVPTPDDYVIINKNGGATVIGGSISQDKLSIGKDNNLTVTGNIEISHVVKINKTASLNWTSGTLQERIGGDFPTINNLGTLTVSAVGIEDTGTIINNDNGVMEINGNININNGRLYNANFSKMYINGDNITIGYTSGSEHLFSNFFGCTIEKTVGSGSGTSSIILSEFTNWNGGIIRSEQGTLAIGESFDNQGILTGSGFYSYPNDFINSGIISPGSSPGTLTVIGNLTTAPAATFDIEIDGPNAGTEYDQVVVTNEAILEGTINITLGYLPANDASFQIVTAGTALSCNNFPATISTDFNGTPFTFDVVCQGNVLYLNGPGATLSSQDYNTDELLVYPNPVKDVLNIKTPLGLNGKWELINHLGQKVLEGKLETSQAKINVSALPSNLYLLQIKDKLNTVVKTQKVIVE